MLLENSELSDSALTLFSTLAVVLPYWVLWNWCSGCNLVQATHLEPSHCSSAARFVAAMFISLADNACLYRLHWWLLCTLQVPCHPWLCDTSSAVFTPQSVRCIDTVMFGGFVHANFYIVTRMAKCKTVSELQRICCNGEQHLSNCWCPLILCPSACMSWFSMHACPINDLIHLVTEESKFKTQ